MIHGTTYAQIIASMSSRTSVATRLAVSALAVSIGSLAVATLVLSSGAKDSAEEIARQRVAVTGTAKADELEAYFTGVQRQVATLAASRTVRDALPAFAAAFNELAAGSVDDLADERAALAAFYLDDFTPALEAANDEAVNPLAVNPGSDPATVYLQGTYIAESPFAMDQKSLLVDAEDGSAWTDVHRDIHPQLRGVAGLFGMDDILLIDAATDAVVYSVAKNVDFATYLGTGPHRGSALAGLVSQVLGAGEPGSVSIADFSFYTPALGAPVLFVAAPVFDDAAEPTGVVAIRLSPAQVNDIMTREWRAGRFGDTGETYLVGADRLMRSDARAFVEDTPGYLQRVEELGVAAADRRLMASLDTTVLLQPVASPLVKAATSDGDRGLVDGTSYQAEDVVTAYQPIEVAGLEWALLSEQQQAEVYRPRDDFVRRALTGTAVFVVALTLLIVVWANTFVNPVRAISAALKRVGDGALDTRVRPEGTAEFRELAGDANQMIADLERRERHLTAAANTKLDLVRRLLPPVAAQRVGAGDRRLLETAPNASVAVLVINGLDALVPDQSADRNRELLHRAVDEVDRVAGLHGVERVKVQGDRYFAVCGVAAPYLDHTLRAVTFAGDARAAIRRLAEGAGLTLDLSGGVHCGSVTVGLIGGSRLVYDLWGDTARIAHRLADMAGRGEILVSANGRDRLPPDRVTERFASGQADLAAWIVAAAPAGTGEPVGGMPV